MYSSKRSLPVRLHACLPCLVAPFTSSGELYRTLELSGVDDQFGTVTYPRPLSLIVSKDNTNSSLFISDQISAYYLGFTSTHPLRGQFLSIRNCFGIYLALSRIEIVGIMEKERVLSVNRKKQTRVARPHTTIATKTIIPAHAVRFILKMLKSLPTRVMAAALPLSFFTSVA